MASYRKFSKFGLFLRISVNSDWVLQKWSMRHRMNKMVSLGDTAISLHILQPPLMGRGCSGKGQIWTQERKLEF